ncbi:hypothetical protein DPMN_094794 [Dreissena polymorpha]|uniref:Uncharacterized protein n=1 Tax=Dreissena polymorpha TaxID=45954 RepID=A0A9D4L655_DREPO|nr:hypothetical protein DPMN_094794 [Dreissena polymorpha]
MYGQLMIRFQASRSATIILIKTSSCFVRTTVDCVVYFVISLITGHAGESFLLLKKKKDFSQL